MENTILNIIGADEPNRIEANALFHWECLTDDEDEFTDEDAQRIKIEMWFFMDHVLPYEPLRDWAFWTDGYEVYSKSKELIEQVVKVIDTFTDGDSKISYYDPSETDDKTAGMYGVRW